MRHRLFYVKTRHRGSPYAQHVWRMRRRSPWTVLRDSRGPDAACTAERCARFIVLSNFNGAVLDRETGLVWARRLDLAITRQRPPSVRICRSQTV
jgi:hypothetical protein